jgi:hypothetical protein
LFVSEIKQRILVATEVSEAAAAAEVVTYQELPTPKEAPNANKQTRAAAGTSVKRTSLPRSSKQPVSRNNSTRPLSGNKRQVDTKDEEDEEDEEEDNNHGSGQILTTTTCIKSMILEAMEKGSSTGGVTSSNIKGDEKKQFNELQKLVKGTHEEVRNMTASANLTPPPKKNKRYQKKIITTVPWSLPNLQKQLIKFAEQQQDIDFDNLVTIEEVKKIKVDGNCKGTTTKCPLTEKKLSEMNTGIIEEVSALLKPVVDLFSNVVHVLPGLLGMEKKLLEAI